jgi:hypothetical protein
MQEGEVLMEIKGINCDFIKSIICFWQGVQTKLMY